jgi:ParB family chromosome partitioning protein
MARTPREDEASFPADAGELVDRTLYEVPLDRLEADPDQPRKFFDVDAMLELKNSVREHGVLQPVIFRRDGRKRLLVVAGERRLRAAREAGEATIPAVYRENVDAAEVALVENLQREGLNPIDEAEALQRMKEGRGYTCAQLGNVVGKAPSTVSEILSLTRLPEGIKELCRKSSRYSRRALVEVAKAGDPAEMTRRFQKLAAGGTGDGDLQVEEGKAPEVDEWCAKVARFRYQLAKLRLAAVGGDGSKLEAELIRLEQLIQEKIQAAR